LDFDIADVVEDAARLRIGRRRERIAAGIVSRDIHRRVHVVRIELFRGMRPDVCHLEYPVAGKLALNTQDVILRVRSRKIWIPPRHIGEIGERRVLLLIWRGWGVRKRSIAVERRNRVWIRNIGIEHRDYARERLIVDAADRSNPDRQTVIEDTIS